MDALGSQTDIAVMTVGIIMGSPLVPGDNKRKPIPLTDTP